MVVRMRDNFPGRRNVSSVAGDCKRRAFINKRLVTVTGNRLAFSDSRRLR